MDYEALVYHACAARDVEAIKRLRVAQATRMRPSVRHLHPMRAPQVWATKPHTENIIPNQRAGPSPSPCFPLNGR